MAFHVALAGVGDALRDCMGNQSIRAVYVGGACSRYLDSLALLSATHSAGGGGDEEFSAKALLVGLCGSLPFHSSFESLVLLNDLIVCIRHACTVGSGSCVFAICLCGASCRLAQVFLCVYTDLSVSEVTFLP